MSRIQLGKNPALVFLLLSELIQVTTSTHTLPSMLHTIDMKWTSPFWVNCQGHMGQLQCFLYVSVLLLLNHGRCCLCQSPCFLNVYPSGSPNGMGADTCNSAEAGGWPVQVSLGDTVRRSFTPTPLLGVVQISRHFLPTFCFHLHTICYGSSSFCLLRTFKPQAELSQIISLDHVKQGMGKQFFSVFFHPVIEAAIFFFFSCGVCVGKREGLGVGVTHFLYSDKVILIFIRLYHTK